jgi:acyl-CoA synthetase (AMP-forming)/AMP-acid ligase II
MWSMLRRQWSAWTDRVALVPERGEPLTYGQLDRLVGRAADSLSGAGVDQDTRVAVALPSGPDLVVTVLAGLACGADVALLNTQWWPRELRAAFEAAQPDLVLTTDDLAPGARDLAPVISLPTTRRDEPPAWSTLRLRTAMAAGAGTVGSGLTCFTAGVWSEPRPVHFSDEQLQAAWATPADEPPETTLFTVDASTAAALRAITVTLASGGTAQLTERWVPGRTARRLAGGDAQGLWATGPQLNQLACLVSASTRWPGLVHIDAVAGMLHRSSAIRLASASLARVATAFTVTEAGGAAARRDHYPAERHHPLDVGPAVPGLSVEVLDERWTRLGTGCVGRLQLRGSGLGTAPIGPSPSGQGGPGPILCTGDLGRLAEDGNLHLMGRESDRFECDGHLVWPALVELALAGHPGISDVAVVPRPDPDLGSVPVAVTVPANPEAPPFLLDLKDRLADLPPSSRPRAQAVVERLPLTGGGQLHRRMLAYDEVAR